MSAMLVPTFADRGCRVVSAEPLLFHSSSSSVILTRLSEPRSRPTTSPTDDKIDVMRDIYQEVDRVFYKFPKYQMKILLDFSAKKRREDIFKPTVGKESLHEISNESGVRVVNFTKSD
jgi:hypothetical protein